MSGRRSKKNQRLGSSRRGPRGLNSNIEKDEDEFQQIAESEDGRNVFHTSTDYHSTQFDHPPSSSIDQQTSALECPPHARGHKDSLMENELPERKRKMGSTRKTTGRIKVERKLDEMRTTEELDEEYLTQPNTSTTEAQHASLTEEQSKSMSFPSDLSFQTKSSELGKEPGTTLMFAVLENEEKDAIHYQEITSHSHEVVSDMPIAEAMVPSVHSIAVTVGESDLLQKDSVMFDEPSRQEIPIASTSGQKRRMGSTRRPLRGKNCENVGVQENSRNMIEDESKAEVIDEARFTMSVEMTQTWDDVARDVSTSHTESALVLNQSLLAERAELKEPDVSAGTETMIQSVAFPLVDSEKPLPETSSHHGTPLLNKGLDFNFGSHTEDFVNKVWKEAESNLSDNSQWVPDTRKDTNTSYNFRDVNKEVKEEVLKQKEELSINDHLSNLLPKQDAQLEELALNDQEYSLSQHDIATLDNNCDCSMAQLIVGGSRSFGVPVSNISHAEPTAINLPHEMSDAAEEMQEIHMEIKQESNVCDVASITCDTLTDLECIMVENEDPQIFAARENENTSDQRGSETDNAFEISDQGDVRDHNVTQIIMDVRDNEKDGETNTETIWISHQKPCEVPAEKEELIREQEQYSSNISQTHSPLKDDTGKMLETDEVRKGKKDSENAAGNDVTTRSEEIFSVNVSATDTGSHAHQHLFMQSPDKDSYDSQENVNEKSEKEGILFCVESENAAFDRGEGKSEGIEGIKDMDAEPVVISNVDTVYNDSESKNKSNRELTGEQTDTSSDTNLQILQVLDNVSSLIDSGLLLHDVVISPGEREAVPEESDISSFIPEDSQDSNNLTTFYPESQDNTADSERAAVGGDTDLHLEIEAQNKTFNSTTSETEGTKENIHYLSVLMRDVEVIGDTGTVESNVTTGSDFLDTSDIQMEALKVFTNAEKEDSGETDTILLQSDINIIPEEAHSKSSPVIHKRKMGSTRRPFKGNKGQRKNYDENEIFILVDEPNPDESRYTAVSRDTELHLENKTFDSTAFGGEATEENICEASVLVKEVEFIADLIQNDTFSDAKLEALKVSDNAECEVQEETDAVPKQSDTTIIPEETQREEAHSEFTVIHKRKMGSTRRPLKGNKGQRKEKEHHDENEKLECEGMISVEKKTFSLEDESSTNASPLRTTKDGVKQQEMELCKENDVGPVEGSESALLQSSCSSDLLSEESTAVSICHVTESQTLMKLNEESHENAGEAEKLAAEEDKDLQSKFESLNKMFDSTTSEAEGKEENINDLSVTLLREVEVNQDTGTVESNMTTESDLIQNDTSSDAKLEALKVSDNAECEVQEETDAVPKQSDTTIIPEDTQREEAHSEFTVIHKRKMGSTRRPLRGKNAQRKEKEHLDENETPDSEGIINVDKETISLENEPSLDESTLQSIKDGVKEQEMEICEKNDVGPVVGSKSTDLQSLCSSDLTSEESTAISICHIKEPQTLMKLNEGSQENAGDAERVAVGGETDLHLEIKAQIKTSDSTSEAEASEENICEASVLFKEVEFIGDTVTLESNITTESDFLQSSPDALKVSQNSVKEVSGETDTILKQSDINIIPEDSHREEAHSKSSPVIHKRKIGSTRRPLKGNKGQRKEKEHHDENESLECEGIISVEKKTFSLEDESSTNASPLRTTKDGVKQQEMELCEENDVGPVEGSESALLQSSCSSDLLSEESTAVSICHVTESQTLMKLNEESQENAGDAEKLAAEEEKDLQLKTESQNKIFDSTTSEAEGKEEKISDVSVTLLREVEVNRDTGTVESNMTTESDFLQTSPDAHIEALKISENAEKEVPGETDTILKQSDISIIPDDSHREDAHSKSSPVIHKRKMGSTRRPLKGNKGQRPEHDEKEIFSLEDEPSPDESIYTAMSVCDISESQTLPKIHAGSQENTGDVEIVSADGDTERHLENKTFDSTAFGGEATEENICEASVLVKEVEFIGDTVTVDSNMTTESDLIQNDTSSDAKVEALKVSDNAECEVQEETDTVPKQSDTTIIPEDTQREEAHSEFTVIHKRKMGSTRRPLRGKNAQRKEKEHLDENETPDSEGIISVEEETIRLENEPSTNASPLRTSKNGVKEQEMELCKENDVGPVEGSESALLQSSCSSDLLSEESTAVSICHVTESQTLMKLNEESQENAGDAEKLAAEEEKDLQLKTESQNKIFDSTTSEAEGTEENISDVSVTLLREVEVNRDTGTVESNMTTESDFLQTSPDAHIEALKISENAEKEVPGETDTILKQSDISIIPDDSHREDAHSKSSPVIHKRKMGSTRRPLKGNKGQRPEHDEKEIFSLEDEPSPDESIYTAVSVCDISESQTLPKIHAGSQENTGDVEIVSADGDTERHLENKTFDSTAFGGEATEENICEASVLVKEVEFIGDTVTVESNMTTESDLIQNDTSSDAKLEALKVSDNAECEVQEETDTVPKQSDTTIIPEDTQREEAHSEFTVIHKRKMGSTRRPLREKNAQRKEKEHLDENETPDSEGIISVEEETIRLENEPSTNASTLRTSKDGVKQQEMEICEKNDVGPVEGSESALLQSSCSSDLLSEESTAVSICHVTESQTLMKPNEVSRENAGVAEKLAAEEDKDLQLKTESQNKMFDSTTSEAEGTEENISDVSVTLLREVEVNRDTGTVESNMTTESDFLQTSPDAHIEALKISENAEKEVPGETDTILKQSDISIIPDDSHREEAHSKSSPVIHKRKMGSTRRPLKGNKGQRPEHDEKEIFSLEDEPSPDESRHTAVNVCDISESQTFPKIHAGSQENTGDVEIVSADGDTERHLENKTFDSKAFGGEATEENICEASVLVKEVEFIGDTVTVDSNMTTESDLIQNDTSSDAKLEALKLSDNAECEVQEETDAVPKQSDTTIIPEDTQREEAHSEFTVIHKRKMGSTRRPLRGKNAQRKEKEHLDENETPDSEGIINVEEETISLKNEPSTNASTLRTSKDGVKQQEMELCEENDVGPVEGSESALLQSSFSSDLLSEESTAVSICHVTELQTLVNLNEESQENAGDAEKLAAEEDKDLQLKTESQNKMFDSTTSEAEGTEEKISDVSVTLLREVEVNRDTGTVESNMTTESDFLQTSPDAHIEALKISENAEKEVSRETDTILKQSDISIFPQDSHREEAHSKSSPVIHKRKMGSTRRPLKGNKGQRPEHHEKEIFSLEDEPSPDESRHTAVNVCDISESQTFPKIHAGSQENTGDVEIVSADGDTELHLENKTFDSKAFREEATEENICEASVLVKEVEFIGDTVTVDSNMTTKSDLIQNDTSSDAKPEALKVSDNAECEVQEETDAVPKQSDTTIIPEDTQREEAHSEFTVIHKRKMGSTRRPLKGKNAQRKEKEHLDENETPDSEGIINVEEETISLENEPSTNASPLRTSKNGVKEQEMELCEENDVGPVEGSESAFLQSSCSSDLLSEESTAVSICHVTESQTLMKLNEESQENAGDAEKLAAEEEKDLKLKTESQNKIFDSTTSEAEGTEENISDVSVTLLREVEVNRDTGTVESNMTTESNFLQTSPDAHIEALKISENAEKEVPGETDTILQQSDISIIPDDSHREEAHSKSSPVIHKRKMGSTRRPLKGNKGQRPEHDEKEIFSLEDEPSPHESRNTAVNVCDISELQTLPKIHAGSQENTGDDEIVSADGDTERHLENKTFDSTTFGGEATEENICEASVLVKEVEFIGDTVTVDSNMTTESDLIQNDTSSDAKLEALKVSDNAECEVQEETDAVPKQSDTTIIPEDTQREEAHSEFTVIHKRKMGSTRRPLKGNKGQRKEKEHLDENVTPDSEGSINVVKETISLENEPSLDESTLQSLKDGVKEQEIEICEKNDVGPVVGSKSTDLQSLCSSDLTSEESTVISICHIKEPQTLMKLNEESQENAGDAERVAVGGETDLHLEIKAQIQTSDSTSEAEATEENTHDASVLVRKIEIIGDTVTVDSNMTTESDLIQNYTFSDAKLEALKVSDNAECEVQEETDAVPKQSDTIIIPEDTQREETHSKFTVIHKRKMGSTRRPLRGNKGQRQEHDEKEIFSLEDESSPDESRHTAVNVCDISQSQTFPKVHAGSQENTGDVEIVPADGDTERHLENKTYDSTTFGGEATEENICEASVLVKEVEFIGDTVTVESNITTESDFLQSSPDAVKVSQNSAKEVSGETDTILKPSDINIIPEDSHREETHSKSNPVIHKRKMGSTRRPLKGNKGQRPEHDEKEIFSLEDEPSPDESRYTEVNVCDISESQTLQKIHVGSQENTGDVEIVSADGDTERHLENKTFDSTAFGGEATEENICEASVLVKEVEFIGDTVTVDSNMTTESDLIQNDTSSDAKLEALKVSDNAECEVQEETDAVPKQSDTTIIPEDTQREEAHSEFTVIHKRKMGSTRRPLRGNKGPRKVIEDHDENETIECEVMISVEKKTFSLEDESSTNAFPLRTSKDGFKEQEMELCKENDVGPVEGSESALLQSSCSSDLLSEESTAVSICHVTELQTLVNLNEVSQENAGDTENLAAEEEKDLQLKTESLNKMFDSTTSEAEGTEEKISDVSVTLLREVEVNRDTGTVESNMTTESDFLQTSPDAHIEALKISENAKKEVSGETDTILKQSDISIIPEDSHREEAHSKSGPVIHKRKMGSTRRPLKGNKGQRLEDEPSPDESRNTAVNVCDISESQTLPKIHVGSQENTGDVEIVSADGDTERHLENKTFDSTAFGGEATEENICEASVLVKEVKFIGDTVTVDSDMTTESDLIQNDTSSDAKLEALKVSDNAEREVQEETDAVPKQSDTTIIPEDIQREEAHSEFTVIHKRKMGSTRRPLRGKNAQRKENEHLDENETPDSEGSINVEKETISLEDEPSLDESTLQSLKDGVKEQEMEICEKNDVGPVEGSKSTDLQSLCSSDLTSEESTVISICHITESQTLMKLNEESQDNDGYAERVAVGGETDLHVEIKAQVKTSDSTSEAEATEENICEASALVKEVEFIGDTVTVESNITTESDFLQSSPDALKVSQNSAKEVSGETDTILKQSDISIIPEDSHREEAHSKSSPVIHKRKMGSTRRPLKGNKGKRKDHDEKEIFSLEDEPSPDESRHTAVSVCDISESQTFPKIHAGSQKNTGDVEIAPAEGDTEQHLENKTFDSTAFGGEATEENICEASVLVKEVEFIGDTVTVESNITTESVFIQSSPDALKVSQNSAKEVLGETDTILKQSNISIIPEDSHREEAHSKSSPVIHKRKMGSTRRPLKGKNGQRNEKEHHDENETPDSEHMFNVEKETISLEDQPMYTAVSDILESQTLTKFHAESQEDYKDVERALVGRDTEPRSVQTEMTTLNSATFEGEGTEEIICEASVVVKEIEFIGDTVSMESNMTIKSDLLQSDISTDAKPEALMSEIAENEGKTDTIPKQSDTNIIPEVPHGEDVHTKLNLNVQKRKMGSTRRPLRGNKGQRKVRVESEEKNGNSEPLSEEEDTETHLEIQNQDNVVDHNVTQEFLNIRDNKDEERKTTKTVEELCDDLKLEQRSDVSQTQSGPSQDDTGSHLLEVPERTADFVIDRFAGRSHSDLFLSDALLAEETQIHVSSEDVLPTEMAEMHPVSKRSMQKRKMGSTRKRGKRMVNDEEVEEEKDGEAENTTNEDGTTKSEENLTVEEAIVGSPVPQQLFSSSADKESHEIQDIVSKSDVQTDISEQNDPNSTINPELSIEFECYSNVAAEMVSDLPLGDADTYLGQKQSVIPKESHREDQSSLNPIVQKRKMGSTRKMLRGNKGLGKEEESKKMDRESEEMTQEQDTEPHLATSERKTASKFDEEVEQNFPVEFPYPVAFSKMFPESENGGKEVSLNIHDLSEVSEEKESTGNDSNSENEAINLYDGTKDKFVLTVSHKEVDQTMSVDVYVGSEPEQTENTGHVFPTQELKSTQDDVVHEISSTQEKRRKMGSTRRNPRVIHGENMADNEDVLGVAEDRETKKAEDDLDDMLLESSIIQSKEVSSVSTTDLESEILGSATDLKEENHHQNNSEPSGPTVPETPQLVNADVTKHPQSETVTTKNRRKMGSTRKNLREGRIQGKRDGYEETETADTNLQMSQDSEMSLGDQTTHDYFNQPEDSLLSEIERALNKTSQSSMSNDRESVVKEPNHISNAPDLSMPEHSEIKSLQPTPLAHSEPNSPGRRRKMGSTRKNPRQQLKAEREDEDKEDEEKDENLKTNKQENKDLERVEVSIIPNITENKLNKEYLDVSSAHTSSSELEESTNPVSQERTSPSTKRKFGSRRTNKGKQGLGSLATSDFGNELEDGDHKLDSSEVEDKLCSDDSEVCDPCLTLQPENQPITHPVSEQRNIEVKNEEVAAKGTVDDPVSSEQIIKHDRSTGAKQAVNLKNRISDAEVVQFNVVMVGNSSVGKTSFIRRFHEGQFTEDYRSTIGVDTCIQTIDLPDRTVKLQIWDTAGQERFHSITSQVFHRADGLLLMYEITCSNSFISVRDWISRAQERAPDDVIMMLLGNKNDFLERAVQIQEGADLAREYNINFMECSAATGANVSESMRTLAELLVQRKSEKERHTTLKREPSQKKSGCC